MLLCYCSTQTTETPQNRIDVNYGLTDLMQFIIGDVVTGGGNCPLLPLVGQGGGAKVGSKDFHIFQILSGPFNKSLPPCSFQTPASLLFIKLHHDQVCKRHQTASCYQPRTQDSRWDCNGSGIKPWIRDRDAI